MIKDNIVFLREFVSEFKSTGTICPTSKRACKGLTKPLRKPHGPISILEIGAGTGAVTSWILRDMGEDDRLTICESNPRFMEELKKKPTKNEYFLRYRDNIDFFAGPVQDISEDRKYDVFVCSLPFLNFDVKTVEEIFSKLRRISKEDTVMTYYEFMALKRIGKVISSPKRKKQLHELETYFLTEYSPRRIHTTKIWLNMLPLKIYTLEMPA